MSIPSRFLRLLIVVVLGCALSGASPSGRFAQTGPGDLDPSFGFGGTVTTNLGGGARALVVQPDGKLVAAGRDSAGAFALERYFEDGSLDPTFGGAGRVLTDFGLGCNLVCGAYGLVLQPDGKLVAAGGAPDGSETDFALARYLPDGGLDPTFGSGGKVVTDVGPGFGGGAFALALQPDGKLVAAGLGPAILPPPHSVFVRYLADGSLDATFGTGGDISDSRIPFVAGIAVQPDGKLVAVGGNAMTRYLPNGARDTTFGTDGLAIIPLPALSFQSALAIQPDGMLVTAGGGAPRVAEIYTLSAGFVLTRHNIDGSIDPTFGTGGIVTTSFPLKSAGARALALEPDGKLLAAGVVFNVFNPHSDQQFGLARYNPDGTPDGTFGNAGRVTTSFAGGAGGHAVAVQPDGKLVVAGIHAVTGEGNGAGFALARYLSGEAPCVVNALTIVPGEQLTVTADAALARGASQGVTGSPGARRHSLDPAAFRRLRDDVLARSPGGRRYAALYAAHSPEVVRVMLADPSLLASILDGLLLWQADVAALADGRRPGIAVTADQARAVEVVLDRLARTGSPALRKAIEEERRAKPRGLPFAEAVVRELGQRK